MTSRSPAATLFLCLFASQTGFLVLTPILPELSRDLGVSTATAGGLRVVSGIAGGVVALVLAAVGRRLGLRDLIAVGLGLVAVGSAASAAAPSFAALGAAQVAVGAGVAALLSGCIAAAGRWSEPGERAGVLSWTLLGQPAAWVVAMPLIGAVAEQSWRLALLAPVLAALPALAVLRRHPADEPATEAAAIWPALRSDRRLAGWAAGELFAYAAWGGTITFAGALLVESYGASTSLAGALLALAALAYFPGTLLARGHVDRSATALLAGLGLTLAPVVALLGAVRPGIAFSAALFAFAVLLTGGRTIAGSAAGLDAAPAQAVAVMGIRAAAAQFGTVAGAAAGGAALAAGGYGLLGLVLSLAFAAGAAPHLAAVRIHSMQPTPGLKPATQGGLK